TVNPLPSAISGTTTVCSGLTTTLSDAGGGTWTSSDGSVANVDLNTGVVTGGTAGTATITYTIPTGCINTAMVTVNPLPSAISGTTDVCQGLTTTLTDAGGGTWTTDDNTIAAVDMATGVVTGVSASTTYITYTLPT